MRWTYHLGTSMFLKTCQHLNIDVFFRLICNSENNVFCYAPSDRMSWGEDVQSWHFTQVQCVGLCVILSYFLWNNNCYYLSRNLFDTVLGTGPVSWMSELVCFISFMMCTIYTTDSVVHTTIVHSTHTDIIWWIAFGWNHGRIIKKTNQRSNSMTGNNGGQGIPTAVTCSIYIYR